MKLLRLLLLLLHISHSFAAGQPISEFRALLSLKSSLTGNENDQHSPLTSWNLSTSFCLWTRVTCDVSRRHVTSLDLSGLNLSGTLSSDISHLHLLQNLSLAANQISGPIPPEISHLSELRRLNLSNNVFNGTYPDELSVGLVNLQVLDLYNNNLTGDLPVSITNLTQLRHLHLGGNYFSGRIPSVYGTWPVLEYLAVSGNELVGKIPPEIGNLTTLQELYIGYFNAFDDGLPTKIGNLSELLRLDAANCGLRGEIPPEIGNLQKLDTLFQKMPSPLSPPLPLILTGSIALTGALLILLTILLYRKLSRNRTAPSDLSPQHYQCRRFSYTQLRRATNSFSDSTQLGHGGFGTVYKADLPSGTSLAVKVMDSSAGSLQGEREFHNELSLSSRLTDSPHVVSLLGFSEDRRNRRLVLVYELMANRSLQESLLGVKCVELMDWNKRFEIATDVAKGIEFLHHCCDPPIIHGDVKPSNVLLDGEFKAKIGDFGLARVKSEALVSGGDEVRVLIEEDDKRQVVEEDEDNGSVLEESESAITLFEEGNNAVSFSPEIGASPGVVSVLSPESCGVSVLTVEASPVSPGLEKGSVSESCVSVESSSKQKVGSKRDWWWKQDNNGGSRGGVESGSVKDYVMEWIGSEIKKESNSNKEWIKNGDGSSSSSVCKKKKKKRKPREWWKEEFCEELTRKKRIKKKKKKRGLSSISSIDSWFHRDNDHNNPNKRKKRNSIDWWVDGLSGDLKNRVLSKKHSQDSGLWCDVNVHKSGGVSSTPSMRGTVCYIAPECGGGGGVLSEKCDVYSFGVLLLVLVSGRRPLQVTASPMSEFERANLISWAKQLACHGNLLELVDKSIHSLVKEQAVLCVTIALLCLQRSPVKRPTMKEIVEMLTGASEPPHLPFEFSPSPPMGFPFKSRKKAR